MPARLDDVPGGVARVALQHALNGVLVVRAVRERGAVVDFEITYANPAACAALGAGPGELTGQRWEASCRHRGCAEVAALIRRAFETGHPQSGAAQIAPRAGGENAAEISFLRLAAAPLDDETAVVSFLDVTEAEAAREEAANASARLAAALEGSGQGLWDWRPPTGACYYSEGWFRMLGYEPGALPSHVDTFFGLLHPEDRESTMASLQRCLAREREDFSFEARLRTADGGWRWVLSRGRVVERMPSGEAARVLGTHTDIEQLKQVQAKLAEARAAAEAASAAKSRFLAGMSHEIRTPMTAILGYADLLAEGVRSPDEQRAWSETIRRTGRDLLGIVGEILDLSQVEAGAVRVGRERCSPAALVGEVCARFRRRAESKGLRLLSEYVTPLPAEIETDPVRVRQILGNLLSNAIRHTGRGTVRVVASLAREEGADRLRVDVLDTGPGIEPEMAARLFTPYEHGAGGGAGLGLSIARELARLLGGDVSLVRSEPEQGSCFRMEVSAEGARGGLGAGEAREAHERAEAEATAPGPKAVRARVLLAEDTPDTAALIETVLGRLGARVEVAANGAEALEKLNSPANGYDVVLMDMQMPVVDGYEATRRLRRAGSRVPIVALTAHAMPEDRRRCLECGCDDYLSKPIDLDRLGAVVEKWAGKRGEEGRSLEA